MGAVYYTCDWKARPLKGPDLGGVLQLLDTLDCKLYFGANRLQEGFLITPFLLETPSREAFEQFVKRVKEHMSDLVDWIPVSPDSYAETYIFFNPRNAGEFVQGIRLVLEGIERRRDESAE